MTLKRSTHKSRIVWRATLGFAFLMLPGCIPTTPAPLRGDVNGDGVVDNADLDTMQTLFGVTADDPQFVSAADLDGDGVIGLSDVQVLAQILASS